MKNQCEMCDRKIKRLYLFVKYDMVKFLCVECLISATTQLNMINESNVDEYIKFLRNPTK